IHPRDKGNRTIFGDAASATIVSNEGYAKIGEFALGTDGSGANNLIVKTGGARNPEKNGDLKFDKDGNPLSSDYLYMNGGEILSFTQENVPKVVSQTLERNGLTKDDIDLCVFHQANKYMLDFLRMKLKVDKEKFYVNMSQVGNTVSNSIPIALCDAQKENKLHGNILLSGFGVGYSWAGVVITTGK
ncbi:MAG: 3-oxoacyl-[acyl-carrier-protein] synthase III C-terminal domain-containing protein, partial [Bacteroidales bacterium]